MRVKLSYTGPEGGSRYVTWDVEGSVDQVLEAIGRSAASGGLYIVVEPDGNSLSIPGRRIELVEVTQS